MYEHLGVIQANDPVTCAASAKHHGLLDTPGWKQFKHLAVRSDKFQWLAHQAQLHTS
jgi:hypothetical protein